jgi:hypothetical protein
MSTLLKLPSALILDREDAMKSFALMISHLAVMGGAWFLASGRENPVAKVAPPTSSSRVVGASGGGILLAEFLAPPPEKPSRYEELKKQLGPVEDHQEAVEALVKRLPKDYLYGSLFRGDPEGWFRLPPPTGEVIAEFTVRVRHWLSDDREACLKFLRGGMEMISLGGNHPVYGTAFADYALEEGEEEWLFKVAGGKEKIYRVRMEELGVRGFLAKYGGDFKRGREDLARVYGAIGFGDRELVLSTIVSGDGGWDKKKKALESYLSNDAHDDSEVMAWIAELRKNGSIPEEFEKESDSLFKDWLGENVGVPVEERWELSSQMDAFQPTLSSFVGTSVANLLNEGRDLSYEFRHGRVAANEVFDDLKSRLGADSAEAEDALRSNLFYKLVTQDALRTQELLTPLSETRRREVQLKAMGAFHYDDPERAKAYYDLLSVSANPAEEKVKQTSWEWQVYYGLARQGEDFVNWIADLPDGDFKEQTIDAALTKSDRVAGGIRDRVRKEFGE